MSEEKETKVKKKKHIDKTQIVVKIVAGIAALSMIIGTVATIIYALV